MPALLPTPRIMAPSSRPKNILLALETSCDETAAAVVTDQPRALSNVVASQIDLHATFGGVVPEIAARAHVRQILPMLDEALRRASTTPGDLAAIAVVTHPGLVGALLIGVSVAKSLALAWDLPLVEVDHLQGHIHACQLCSDARVFPCVGLVVSGGHTSLYACKTALEFELLGCTHDDAAGEAFDKVASILGLGYPGGPAIDRVARGGNRAAFRFPRAFLRDDRLDFSFSGLKTAVLYTVQGRPGPPLEPRPPLEPQRLADLAASFQEAVVDVLIEKALQALERTGCDTLCVGGGVAANARFRERLDELARLRQVRVVVPPMALCTDNAAMAGATAWELLKAGRTADLSVDARPGLA